MSKTKEKTTYSVQKGFAADYVPEGAKDPVRRYFTRQDAHLIPLIPTAKREELQRAGLIAEFNSAADVPIPVVGGPQT